MDTRLCTILVLLTVVVSGVSLGAPKSEDLLDVDRAAREDAVRPVRQGGVNGQAYWNGLSVMFQYPQPEKRCERQEAKIVWKRDSCVEKGRYLGWPTAAKLPSGEILVAFSGDRSRHICPWGREELIRSSDGGETWGGELVLARHAGDYDNCGYPTTVEFGGGEFLTVFYRLCPEAKTSVAATKWRFTENEQEVLK